jgi:hypothetical protein
VPLSNWLYLIRNPAPAFFLLLHFDKTNKFDQAHLVHIGAKYIEAVQKELRLLTKGAKTRSKAKKLNTSKMQFTWSDSDLLSSLDGHGLQSTILKYIPTGFDDYVKWKQEQCAKVGYENGNAQLNFTALMPKHLDIGEHLVNFDLGLVPFIEIEKGEHLDDRFGIPVLVETLPAGTRLQVIPAPESIKGQVVITPAPPRGKIFLDCEVYLPKAFGKFVDPSKLKARFDSGDWTFLVPFAGGSAVTAKFKLPDLETVLPLSRLDLSAQTILALEASTVKATPLDLSISYNNQRLGYGRIDALQGVSPSLIKWAQMIECAWIVARHFSIEAKVEVNAGGLARQYMKLVLSSDYVMPQPRRLKVSTWLNSPDLKTDAAWCVPLPTTVELGRYKVQFAAALLGKIQPSGNKQNDMWEYNFFADSVCKCFEEILTSADGPGKSFEELRTIASEHHKNDNEILYVEFTT